MSSRDRRRLFARASKSGVSSRKLKDDLGLAVSSRHVRRLLRGEKHFSWQKMMRTPKLTERHKKDRINYATSGLQLGDKWQTVIFSDEKKFNLDGPDGFHQYWRDLRRESRRIWSRNFGGGSVMIWAAISFNGKSDIAFLSGRQKSEDYQSTLENFLVPFGDRCHDGEFIFMQDNASIHKSTSTNQWFESKRMLLLDHPALSPDLNPIENCWGILARSVYADGKQYHSIPELKVSIRECWRRIELPTIQALINSMPARLRDVLLGQGRMTKY